MRTQTQELLFRSGFGDLFVTDMAKVGVDIPTRTVSKSNRGSWVSCDRTLNGKTALITGANTGIGLETAVDLARRNAKVVIACRSSKKGEEAVEQVSLTYFAGYWSRVECYARSPTAR